MDDLIINAAITGMVPRKADTPHVPITPDQCIADARRCFDAGASIVHIHAREPDGNPDYRAEVFQEIADGIRDACPGMLICASTSGRQYKTFEQRSASLECRPELATLTCGSLNFPNGASVNEPKMIVDLATAMTERDIVPEMEFFDLGMIDFARDVLVAREIVKPPLYCNILLGNKGTAAATARNLAFMVDSLPAGTTWSAAGIGRYQFDINALAVATGGHVRIGLEDNIWYDAKRTQLATNASLIERIVKTAHSLGRRIAGPDQARRIIGIPTPSALRGEAWGEEESPEVSVRPQNHTAKRNAL